MERPAVRKHNQTHRGQRNCGVELVPGQLLKPSSLVSEAALLPIRSQVLTSLLKPFTRPRPPCSRRRQQLLQQLRFPSQRQRHASLLLPLLPHKSWGSGQASEGWACKLHRHSLWPQPRHSIKARHICAAGTQQPCLLQVLPLLPHLQQQLLLQLLLLLLLLLLRLFLRQQ